MTGGFKVFKGVSRLTPAVLIPFEILDDLFGIEILLCLDGLEEERTDEYHSNLALLLGGRVGDCKIGSGLVTEGSRFNSKYYKSGVIWL